MPNQAAEILLIEDNASDVMLVKRAFQKHTYAGKLHAVRDGAEALEFIFCTGVYSKRPHENPRVILLDKHLPLVDGMEVLRQIRNDPRTRMVPVVMLTSSVEDRDIIESFNLGVNSYVVKPGDFDQFSATLQHVAFYWLNVNQHPALLPEVRIAS